jgi:Fur family transcriptional regulator, zinc uptake regulator
VHSFTLAVIRDDFTLALSVREGWRRGSAPRRHGAWEDWTYIMATIFPAPDHDHARCSADVIAHAEMLCATRAQRLTPSRREVLEILASSHKPLGAYDVIDLIARSKRRPAPITVYRALDFLMRHGLVHRIESRNAYLACAHNHDIGALVAFLICDRCGAVGEASTAAIAQLLAATARKSGFRPALSVIEITGICSHCRRH